MNIPAEGCVAENGPAAKVIKSERRSPQSKVDEGGRVIFVLSNRVADDIQYVCETRIIHIPQTNRISGGGAVHGAGRRGGELEPHRLILRSLI